MTVKVVDYIPVKSDTLIGFATVEFEDLGFKIPGFAIHQSENRRWVESPFRPSAAPTKPGKKEVMIKVLQFYDKRKENRFIKDVLIELDNYICCNSMSNVLCFD